MRRPAPGALDRAVVAVVNGRASAGGRDHSEVLADARAALQEAGARVEARVTRSEAELAEALALADGRRVVLVGGDGSLQAALNAGVELPEIALIPAGRANNVARALALPSRLVEAARIAVGAPAVAVDALEVSASGLTLRCIEGLSAGLQAAARHAYEGANSADVRAGARALAGALRRYRPFEVELEADGETVYAGPGAQVFLSNLPFFGFGFRVNPGARWDDGLLEAIVLRARSRAAAARLLLSVRRGTHLEGAIVRSARRAVLRVPLPLAGDSVPLPASSASVSVLPAAVRIASPWKP